MSVWSDVTGALDHYAGSTDEAIGRSFDNKKGGGVYDGVASVSDHLAGSTDEAVGRFLSQSGKIAGSDLNAGQRATAYTRLLTRHTLGRGAEDVAFEGSFMGNEDTVDLPGPSVGPSRSGSGWTPSVDWRDESSPNPTDPKNWAPEWLQWLFKRPKVAVTIVVALVVLQIAGPALELGANVTDGA